MEEKYNISALLDKTSDLSSVDVVIAKHVGHFEVTPIMRAIGSVFGTNVSTSEYNNASTFCQADAVPSIYDYYTAMNVAGITLFSMGGAAVVFILFLYGDTLKHILKYAPPLVKTHTAFVLSVYPVVAMATYCAIIVPRAQLLAEAVTQGMFMASVYQLFCLLVAYCGGEAELIRRVKPDSLNPRVGPCCCWPCCCLPFLTVNKKHVRYLRLLILQLPLVQGLVYMILLVMWAEEESLYLVNYMYLQPLVILSILFGIWGISMTIKMLSEILKDHHLQGKFIVLQMVLLLAKMQGLILRIVVWCEVLPCKPPITPTVYCNLIYNSIMLAEMVVLGILARLLYKRELPDIGLIDKYSMPNQVCVISDKLAQITTDKTAKDKIVHALY